MEDRETMTSEELLEDLFQQEIAYEDYLEELRWYEPELFLDE